MSVWKKASKAHQKTHRERHQPEARKHLGLLEKKKDYIKRAKDFNEKKETIKLLKKRALNKNPDEFYYHMINSKTEDGKHFEKETEPEDSSEQIKLMRSQDLKYITMKKTLETKKIEKLQAQLHLQSVNTDTLKSVNSKHIYFDKNLNSQKKQDNLKQLSEKELPDINIEELKEVSKEKKNLYFELSKRIEREKELAVVQQKIELQKNLENRTNILKPKRLKKGNKDRPALYVWKYERKK